MAVNTSRSMIAELQEGVTDGRYMKLAPNWNTESTAPQFERLDWPGYARVGRNEVGVEWLIDSPARSAVTEAQHRNAIDHDYNPVSGTRETLMDPDAYKFSQNQKGADR